ISNTGGLAFITYQEARQLFKEPAVLVDEQELDIKWSAPDEEAIEKIKAAKNKSSEGQCNLKVMRQSTPN
ncbi:hypothetical protein Tsubulata_046788, partial [Turnera subulata]